MKKYIETNLFTTKGHFNQSKAKALDSNTVNEINKLVSFLEPGSGIMEKCYCITHNITEKINCKECQINFVQFKNFSKGYDFYCSRSCSISNRNKDTDNLKKKAESKIIDHNDIVEFIKLNLISDITGGLKTNYKHFMRKTEFDIINRLINIEDMLLEEKIYLIYNQKNRANTCLSCFGSGVFLNFKDGYRKYCSVKCAHNTDIVLNKIRETNLEKYGVTDFRKSDLYKEKTIITSKEKYNVEHYSQSDTVKNKKNKTNIERYGVKNFNNHEKAKETLFSKYGVYNPMHVDIFKQKVIDTNKTRYGVDHPFQNKQIYLDMLLKNSTIYGVTHFLKLDIYKDKLKNTMMKKFGVEHNMYKNIKNLDIWLNKDLFILKYNSFDKMEDISEYFNVSVGYLYKKISDYDLEFKDYNKSKSENEISDFCKSLTTETVDRNNRKILNGKEIDICVEKLNFGIEYNGLMYHSYGKSKHNMFNNFDNIDQYRHLRKTELSLMKNFSLIHIFENEWLDPIKQNICKSIISTKLGVNNKIYARNCVVKEISHNLANDFLIENHIQGKINSSVKIALYHKDEIVSVMTLGKSRYNKNYDWELLRLASKTFLTVVGGASKMLKYFEQTYKPKSLISYSDRRFSNGNVYNKIGFEYMHSTKPNYFYFKTGKYTLESRVGYQKHKLKDILLAFDASKTEMENMFDNGYRVIFDCGNMVFVKQY